MKRIYKLINDVGKKMQDLSYVMNNRGYRKIRKMNADRTIFRLLNKPWFKQINIDTVLDIGANEGQFLRTIKTLLPDAEVFCFEPNPEVFTLLKECNYKKVEYHQVACGQAKDVVQLYVSKFSPASSLLQFNKELSEYYPGTEMNKTVEVNVVNLDNYLKDRFTQKRTTLMKLDVQGFELEVLKGSVNLLARTAIVVCEINSVNFYHNQASYADIIQFLATHNFKVIDIAEPVKDINTGEVLYFDLAFKNNSI